MKDKHLKMYMRTAFAVAETSSAKRLKVGAVAVKNGNSIATGYNGLPSTVDGSCEEVDENGIETTSPMVRHAEMNLILNLAKSTESSTGCSVFVTHSCCESCARLLIDAGVKEVYYSEEYRDRLGIDLLENAGISVKRVCLESEKVCTEKAVEPSLRELFVKINENFEITKGSGYELIGNFVCKITSAGVLKAKTEGSTAKALVRGAMAVACVDESVAEAWVKGSMSSALADGSVASAWANGAIAEAWVEGAKAMGLADGSVAQARAKGAVAKACAKGATAIPYEV